MRKLLLISVSALALEYVTPAHAQSGCASIAPGAVLTAAQWNQCFQNKQDFVGSSSFMGVAPITVTPSGGIISFGLSVGPNLTVSGGALTTTVITNVQSFTSNGTWTAASGISSVWVMICGA